MNELQNLAAKYLVKSKEKSKEFYDRKSEPLGAKVGDQVYVFKEVRTNEFDKRAEGPYTIVGFTKNNDVTLENKNGHRVTKH